MLSDLTTHVKSSLTLSATLLEVGGLDIAVIALARPQIDINPAPILYVFAGHWADWAQLLLG